jgi:hypothetical protein
MTIEEGGGGTAATSNSSGTTDYTPMEKDGVLLLQAQQQRIESHTRSLLKGLTWRVLATSTTTIIAYFITGHIDSALRIGALEFLCKLLIYYVVRSLLLLQYYTNYVANECLWFR